MDDLPAVLHTYKKKCWFSIASGQTTREYSMLVWISQYVVDAALDNIAFLEKKEGPVWYTSSTAQGGGGSFRIGNL